MSVRTILKTWIGRVKIFYESFLLFWKVFPCKQLIWRLISRMSHKAATVAKTKKDHYRLLTTNDKGSVSSVSCEKPDATVAHLSLG
jgi:hypothetical protein